MGNLGFDAEKAVAEGRAVRVDWAHAVAPKTGTLGGLPAAEAALSAALVSRNGSKGVRVLVDLSRSLPERIGSVSLEDVSTKLLEVAKGAGALSLFLVPRARGVAPAPVEAFDLVLDLRPLKPAGVGLAVVAIGGTPLPRSGMVLAAVDGRLGLESATRAASAPPAPASRERPVCKSGLPPRPPDVPVSQS